MTEPMDTDAILAFRDATKAFGGKDVVKNVSLRFSRNSMTAIVGTSGAGKSTLLRLANGLIKPDSGEVLFGQGKAAQAPDPVARRRIGFVFQSIALFPHLTVAENIAIGPSLRSLPTDKDDLFRWLDLVELPRALADRLPHQLSGGQQQRVGIARALAPAPEMLLLDEPFAALDPVTRNSLAQKVRVLHEQLGLTSIIVTHDMAEALLMADRVLVMHEGRLVADETPGALLAGAGGQEAQALLAVPREQARRLAELQA